jgi:hypothetical protein
VALLNGGELLAVAQSDHVWLRPLVVLGTA